MNPILIKSHPWIKSQSLVSPAQAVLAKVRLLMNLFVGFFPNAQIFALA